ncbi:hypothetical protein [Amycolatopsis minnesotensis]|uniref:Ferredoxin reductase n=1 Tax=Amycolatopsis minnesotensis TaxID=337894 RepID=A0ABP5D7H6_9PSEU
MSSPAALAATEWRPRRRNARLRVLLKHPAVSPYVRLGAFVCVVNALVVLASDPLPDPADLALVNLAVAVLIRQRLVVNALFRAVLRVPLSWPYPVRWAAGKVSHFGGIHVGAATCGVLWYVVATIGSVSEVEHGRKAPSSLILSAVIAAGLVVMTAAATRPVRERWHDLFERTHRWIGWTLLVLMVADVFAAAIARVGFSWRLVVVALVALSAALPWLSLRRVPIVVERLSRHAAAVRFPHPNWVPLGSAIAFSRAPWREWHPFAIVGSGTEGRGEVIVSRAGDWTSRFIDDPPDHIWLKGGATAGMGSVEALFPRVLFVATGSGIGPLMTVMTRRTMPFRVLWVTRDPLATYGEELTARVRGLDADAVVWDTTRHGKPDTVRLVEQCQAEFGAEAVICVSNKKLTWAVVGGMEASGVAAYGAIWDS